MLPNSWPIWVKTHQWVEQPVTPMCGVDLLINAAQRAAADNRAKARNEAGRGAFKFAKLHEVASITYDEDAEAMIANGAPIHRSMDHYAETSDAYRRLAERRIASARQNDLLAIAS